MQIKENTLEVIKGLPSNIKLVGAAKGKQPQDILEAIDGGLEIVGENYIQDAVSAFSVIGNKVKWHFIGHLQTNKVKKAVEIFDMIETVDSNKLAEEINSQCEKINKIMPVLIEINSAGETQKFGVLPEDALNLCKKLSYLKNIKVMGLMTMGPFLDDPQNLRPYFTKTKLIFDEIKKAEIPDIEMRYLSMGMTDSYKIAIEEGANMVRIGTLIFGRRINY